MPATINPISSPITAKIKSVVLGYKKPNCVWFPFNNPIPVRPPAPDSKFRLMPSSVGMGQLEDMYEVAVS